MPAKGITVDGSFDCGIRTTSTEVVSGGPRRVPLHPMRGRRWIRVFNNGGVEDGNRINVKVTIGAADVALQSSDIQGFGLDIDEYVDLPFDDSITIYAIAELGEAADLRTIELR